MMFCLSAADVNMNCMRIPHNKNLSVWKTTTTNTVKTENVLTVVDMKNESCTVYD